MDWAAAGEDCDPAGVGVGDIADRITVMYAGVVIGTLPPGGSDLERAFFELVLADDERRGR